MKCHNVFKMPMIHCVKNTNRKESLMENLLNFIQIGVGLAMLIVTLLTIIKFETDDIKRDIQNIDCTGYDKFIYILSRILFGKDEK